MIMEYGTWRGNWGGYRATPSKHIWGMYRAIRQAFSRHGVARVGGSVIHRC